MCIYLLYINVQIFKINAEILVKSCWFCRFFPSFSSALSTHTRAHTLAPFLPVMSCFCRLSLSHIFKFHRSTPSIYYNSPRCPKPLLCSFTQILWHSISWYSRHHHQRCGCRHFYRNRCYCLLLLLLLLPHSAYLSHTSDATHTHTHKNK